MTNCSSLEYTGSICRPYFNVCINSLINIAPNIDSTIQLIFIQLDNEDGIVSGTCRNSTETLKTFLCQVAYQPCDSVANVIQPARSMCEDLRDEVCPSEWEFLKNTAFRDLLPECSALPPTALMPNCSSKFWHTLLTVIHEYCITYIP